MQLKFSLLDEEDLKLVETMLVRAGLRIFRQLAREGLLSGAPASAPAPAPERTRIVGAPSPNIQTSQWPLEPALPPVPPAPPPAPSPPPPPSDASPQTAEEEDALVVSLAGLEREPSFLRPPPPAAPPPPVSRRPPETPPPKVGKRKYRSVQQVCRTVADRPHGFISTEEAYGIMGGVSPSGQLSSYINNREVEAAIVVNIKPPTKGLPGRLMVNKESLLKRLELRDSNKVRSPKERVSAPVSDTSSTTSH